MKAYRVTFQVKIPRESSYDKSVSYEYDTRTVITMSEQFSDVALWACQKIGHTIEVKQSRYGSEPEKITAEVIDVNTIELQGEGL